MRLFASLPAALTLAAFAMPVLAASEHAPVRLAQAGPPTSGWGSPATPQAAPSGPPSSGWGQPSPQAAPAPPSAGWGAPSAPASAPAASFGPGGGGRPQRDCMGEITPLLTDADQKGKAIQAAAATKKQPVVCQAFRNLATAEGKVIKYFEDHGAECRVPPDALKARRGNFAKIVEIRTKVCDTAAAPKRAPSLSDALGTSQIPSVSTDTPAAKSRGSTFDTLTGNPLTR
jgi:hypothetical protein